MIFILKKGATKKQMDNISAKLKVFNGVDTKKYGGTIKLKEDPLAIQKKMRDEWEQVFVRYQCSSQKFRDIP